MSWFVDKVLPGLLTDIPFIAIVGFGWHWHRKTIKATVDASNKQANESQTHELVNKLGGKR